MMNCNINCNFLKAAIDIDDFKTLIVVYSYIFPLLCIFYINMEV